MKLFLVKVKIKSINRDSTIHVYRFTHLGRHPKTIKKNTHLVSVTNIPPHLREYPIKNFNPQYAMNRLLLKNVLLLIKKSYLV